MTETLVDLFNEINTILRELQRRKKRFSSETCLVCCDRLYPTAEAYWEHLHSHTVEEVKEIRDRLLEELKENVNICRVSYTTNKTKEGMTNERNNTT